MLSPVILFNMVLGIIGSVPDLHQCFPDDQWRTTAFDTLYRAIPIPIGLRSSSRWALLGVGLAVLFAIILVFTLVQLRLSDAWVYYEGGEG